MSNYASKNIAALFATRHPANYYPAASRKTTIRGLPQIIFHWPVKAVDGTKLKVIANLYYPGYAADNTQSACKDAGTGATVKMQTGTGAARYTSFSGGKNPIWNQYYLAVALGLVVGGIAAHTPISIINSVCDQRLAFLKSLNTFPTFGKGWTKRVTAVRQQALDRANGEAETKPVSAEASQAYDIVRLGSAGEWVSKLQTALNIKVDGKFGPATEAALKKFQEENNLTIDGVAGRNTYRALGLLE